MDAEFRTIVALTGERFVVLPEDAYRALMSAANATAAAATPKANVVAQVAVGNATAARPAAVKAAAVKPVAMPVAAARVATANSTGRPRCSLEDVLLRG